MFPSCLHSYLRLCVTAQLLQADGEHARDDRLGEGRADVRHDPVELGAVPDAQVEQERDARLGGAGRRRDLDAAIQDSLWPWLRCETVPCLSGGVQEYAAYATSSS